MSDTEKTTIRTYRAQSVSPVTAERIERCADAMEQQRGDRPSNAQVIGEAVKLFSEHLGLEQMEQTK